MPSNQSHLSIRDIPNLDDRLVRFLEMIYDNQQQLLALLQGVSDSSSENANPALEKLRSEFESQGLAPINVEALRGKLGQSQLANIPNLTSLPPLNDITYEDGDAVSVSTTVYIRNRSSDPGSWDPITAAAVGTDPSFNTVNVTTSYKHGGTKVIGAQGAAVADAAGGATIDAEARTALNALLARVRASTGHGLIA